MREPTFVKLDKWRRLRFTVSSFQAVQAHLGLTLEASGKRLDEGMAARDAAAVAPFVWGGLSWEDPTLSIERVAQILARIARNPRRWAKLARAMSAALTEMNASLDPALAALGQLRATLSEFKGSMEAASAVMDKVGAMFDKATKAAKSMQPKPGIPPGRGSHRAH